jgi:hypothetical protein
MRPGTVDRGPTGQDEMGDGDENDGYIDIDR